MARYYNSYTQYVSAPPVQLCIFLMVLLTFLGFTWFVNYDSMVEDLMDQLKLGLMLFPVLLLLALHCLSTDDRRPLIPMPEQDTIHRAGASPWGVALLLVFLMFMISYHTSIRESWWPLLSK
ncbi:hypothetical protein RND81_04G246700 [Saponaria officinalis]|uniref:Uncharacterized protein n=1 Tax=Saponaria officinalis TaxID=3572 RepID=A0AAW1LN34_SAPOF